MTLSWRSAGRGPTCDWLSDLGRRLQRLRPRRCRRPPPDARARRVLRPAPPVSRRRLRHDRAGDGARPHGPRPRRGRLPAVPGERHRPRLRRRGRRAVPRRLGLARGAKAASSTPSSTPPTGRSAATSARRGALLAASADYAHSYPHSWRSHAKLIFRATPQWFIPMDAPSPSPSGEGRETAQSAGPGVGPERVAAATLDLPTPGPSPEGEGGQTLRQRALAAIADTRWVPERSRNRITAMVAGRPDWVISRQRAWGVPITLFVDRHTGEYLRDAAVDARIVAAVGARRGGCMVGDRPGGFPRARARPGQLRADRRHPRRLVRQRLDPRLRRRGALRAGRPRRHLCRGVGPAPRLVPVVAARKRRHARRRAVQERPDLRHGLGRAGPQDVEVGRQRRRPHRHRRHARGRYPAPVGRQHRLFRRRQDRQGGPRRPDRRLSQAAQHLPLPAWEPRRLGRGRAAARGRHARARTLGSPPPGRARRRAARPRGELRLRADDERDQRLREPGPVGLLLRRPQGQPVLRRAVVGKAPRLPHRARRAVPRAGPLAEPGAGVHRRRGMADALPRRGERAPGGVAGLLRLARRGAGGAVGAVAGPARPRHAGDRARAQGQDAGVEPGGRPAADGAARGRRADREQRLRRGGDQRRGDAADRSRGAGGCR